MRFDSLPQRSLLAAGWIVAAVLFRLEGPPPSDVLVPGFLALATPAMLAWGYRRSLRRVWLAGLAGALAALLIDWQFGGARP